MIPTPEFQIAHYKMREWVPYVLKDCTDKEAAFDNWMQRDILFAKQVKTKCEINDIPCLITDGIKSEDEVYDIVKKFLGITL